jgi:hypothetical protein
MGVNLKKSYAKLNEKLAAAFDGMGVRRGFTIPYVEGHSMADHINAINQVTGEHGGLANFLLQTYHTDGKWGSGDGETVGHPVDRLRSTVIPKDDKGAKEAIEAAQDHINNFKKLLGDDDADVTTAQRQLDLVKATDGTGMNAFEFGVFLQNIMLRMTQKVGRMYMVANANTPANQLESGTGAAEKDHSGDETSEPGGNGAQGTPGGAQAAPQGSEAGAAPAAPGGAQAAPGGAPQTAPAQA